MIKYLQFTIWILLLLIGITVKSYPSKPLDVVSEISESKSSGLQFHHLRDSSFYSLIEKALQKIFHKYNAFRIILETLATEDVMAISDGCSRFKNTVLRKFISQYLYHLFI